MLFQKEIYKYKSMSNNTFNGRRFLLLWKQHFTQNTKLLILSSVVYVGVVFLVLTIAQIGRQLIPNGKDVFQGLALVFFFIFGILYVGHAFSSFRSKESTISYLMVPASVLEKFLFEFISRIAIIVLALPLLYWAAFNLQGYFFSVFTGYVFEPIGWGALIEVVVTVDGATGDLKPAVYTFVSLLTFLALVVPFTGATIFNKQPLVKTLFSLVLIFLFYFGYAYIAVVHLGLKDMRPPKDMWLFPFDSEGATPLWWLNSMLIITHAVMFFVGYRKLKEKEV